LSFKVSAVTLTVASALLSRKRFGRAKSLKEPEKFHPADRAGKSAGTDAARRSRPQALSTAGAISRQNTARFHYSQVSSGPSRNAVDGEPAVAQRRFPEGAQCVPSIQYSTVVPALGGAKRDRKMRPDARFTSTARSSYLAFTLFATDPIFGSLDRRCAGATVSAGAAA